MITKLKLYEVKEIEPETVEHFMLMQKDIDAKIESRWVLIYMSTNYDWVANSIERTKESNKKYYPEKHFELKIFSVRLPS